MSPEHWQGELLYTLQCIQEVRAKCDRTELSTVKLARQGGLTWTDIATALGVTRQAVHKRWSEVDEST